MAVLALLFIAVVALDMIGVPQSLTDDICRCGSHFNVYVSMQRLRCGPISGLSCRRIDLKYDTEAGPVHFTANDAKVSIAWMNLLRRKGLPFAEMAFRDGVVELLTPTWRRLYSAKVSGMVFSSDGIDEGKASVLAEFEGIRLRLQARMNGLASIGSMNGKEDERRISPRPNEELCLKLEGLARHLKEFDFGIDDTVLTANASLNVNEPEKMELSGAFNVGDAVMAGIMVSRLRGRMAVRDKLLIAEDVVWFSDKGVLRGKFSYDLKDNTLYSRGSGKVEPAMVARLIGNDFKGASLLKDMVVPWNVRWHIPEVQIGTSNVRLKMECDFKDIEAGGLAIKSGGFNVEFQNDTIEVSELHVTRGNHDHLQGSVSCNLKRGTIAFDVSGGCDAALIAQELGVNVNSALRRDSDMRLAFDFKLAESPLSLDKWNLSGNCSMKSLSLDDWKLNNLNTKIRLDSGRLFIEDGSFLFGKSEVLPCMFSTSTDISELFAEDNGDCELDVQSHFELGLIYGDRHDAALKLDSGVKWKPFNGTLSFSGKGTAYGDRIYDNYLADSGIKDIDLFSPFKCNGAPVEFEMELPTVRLNDLGKFRLQGKLKGTDCAFGRFSVKNVSCGLFIDGEKTVFSDIKGTTVEGYDAALNVEIIYSPFVLNIKDLKLKGDPSVCEPYVMQADANEIYKAIWQDVEWCPDALPSIDIPIISYVSGSSYDSYSFKMKASIKAPKYSYKGNEVSDAELEMSIDLPDNGLEIKPISMTLDGTRLHGNCFFSFGNQPMLSFKIEDASGALDIKKAMARINPELFSEFKHLELEGVKNFFCEGNMYLSGPMDLRVKGNIGAGAFRLNDMEITDFDAKWFFENGKIRWDVMDAKYLDGSVNTTGDYDLHSRKGDILLLGKRLSWAKLLAVANRGKEPVGGNSKGSDGTDAKEDAVPGYVDFECSVKCMTGWAGRPYNLEGVGHFALREADLWNVPLMRNLEHLLEISTFKLFSSKGKEKTSLGQITSLSTDVEFMGTRVVFPNISTDGTLIALSGSGEYSWEKDRLKAYISGEALKDISLISIILKPFSWAFHAELTGTKDKAEWKMRTALSKLND